MLPIFGTSTYVWTAIIGVILGALAVGNWYGGRLADRTANLDVLTRIIIFAAFLLLIDLALQPWILSSIASSAVDLRLKALGAALFLFAPPAIFMGMVSPYLAKLRLTNLSHAGQSVGTLYAAGTLGSIIGTFAVGYWLLGAFGNRTLGWALVLCLILLSFAVRRRGYLGLRLLIVGLVIILSQTNPLSSNPNLKLVYDTDSSYGCYLVYEAEFTLPESFGQRLRYLLTDDQGIQSGVNLSKPLEPQFDYTERFVEAAETLPESPKRILMIGGGSFTVPQISAARFPDVTIDVVEIDPKLTDIARDYFAYKASPRIRIVNQDGRYYLNNTTQRYDVIYMDVFTALAPPFQLTTRETVARLAASLQAKGIVVVNLVAHVSGSSAAFGRASYATYDHLAWFQSSRGKSLTERQNITLLATQSKVVIQAVGSGIDAVAAAPPRYSDSDILTDDFAPVERLTNQ